MGELDFPTVDDSKIEEIVEQAEHMLEAAVIDITQVKTAEDQLKTILGANRLFKRLT